MIALVAMAGLPPVAMGCEMLADDVGRLPPEAAVAWAEAGGHPFLEGHEIVAAWDTSA
jgi:3,4-dihydroxy-2-butanone 4-phosphate synthase